MKSFERVERTKEQIEAQRELERRMRKIPAGIVLPEGQRDISCHTLVHALSQFEYPVPIIPEDGWFLERWPHSWFVQREAGIFDVRPVRMWAGSNDGVLFVDFAVAVYTELYEHVDARKRRFAKLAQIDPEVFNADAVVSPISELAGFQEAVALLADVMSD